MNKYLLRNFLYAICMATLLFACDDNDDQSRKIPTSRCST